MPTYLFYPHRADGVSLTFIAKAADDDVQAMGLASEIAQAHDCIGVFVWAPAAAESGKDRFVGEMSRATAARCSPATDRQERQCSGVGPGLSDHDTVDV